jgi:hypothetical protein
VAAAGVPLSDPPALKVTLAGNAPVLLNAEAGEPLAVIWKLPATPMVKVTVFVLVMCGGLVTALIVMLKFWVAFPAVFRALTVPVKVPVAVGVPVIAPPALKLSPVGNAPALTLKVGAGEPIAV